MPTPSLATVAAPSTLTVGVASACTVSLNAQAPSGGLSFTPSASGLALAFSPSSVTIAAGNLTASFTATASASGSGQIGGPAPGITVTPPYASSLEMWVLKSGGSPFTVVSYHD